jgi:hypothetical protein
MNLVTLALIVAAALVLGGRDLVKHGREFLATLPIPELSSRQIGAAALLIAAIVSYHWSQPVSPAPVPTPAPAGPLDLRGMFRGPTAAEDAALVGSLCGELADELEWDGGQAEPYLKTAIAIDELRQRARELRCRGVSIGARQPAARDAIARHLDAKVGTAGGPITPEQRAAWVAAFRDIEGAAANVVR